MEITTVLNLPLSRIEKTHAEKTWVTFENKINMIMKKIKI